MYRCGIHRADGTIRLGILCERCSLKALEILLSQGKPFYRRAFDGDTRCEACLEHKSLAATKEG